MARLTLVDPDEAGEEGEDGEGGRKGMATDGRGPLEDNV